MVKVLLVDDDPKLVRMLSHTLLYEGFDVVTASDGREALTRVQEHRPSVIVLDWLMPGLSGIEVAQRLRAAEDRTMILMLTARDTIEDRVEGLESGADDYLVKPFAPAELLARVRALLRRSESARAEQPLVYADLTLDPLARRVRRSGRQFDLTLTEFELLHCLMLHPNQVLRREQILEAVWGYDFEGEDNVLEVYIGYLRKKTEAEGEPRLIQTVRGVGYVLREE